MKMFKTLQILGVLALAGAASAAGTAHYMRVNVPFAFVVSGQQFSAGNYRVTETENGLVTLQGEGKAVVVISTPLSAGKANQSSALRFTNKESHAYLTSIAIEGEGIRAVPARMPTESKTALMAQ